MCLRVGSWPQFALFWVGVLALALLLGWRADAVRRAAAENEAALDRVLPRGTYLYYAADAVPPEALAVRRIDRRAARLRRERVALAIGFVLLAGAAAVVSGRWAFAD